MFARGPFKDTPRTGCIIAHKERFFHLAQSASGGREVNESMFDDRWASSAIQSMLDQVSVNRKKVLPVVVHEYLPLQAAFRAKYTLIHPLKQE